MIKKLNTNKKKKVALYNKFSKNLEHVSNCLGINFGENHNTDSYICPLSFKIYTRQGLDDIFDDQLTAEHVPPNSLNGKVVTLTTKNSNSESGYTHDFKMKEFINVTEFEEGKSPIPSKFKINDKYSFNGEISRFNQLQINLSSKTKHLGARKFLDLWNNKGKFDLSFSLPSGKIPELAFLRVAYLLAFSEFGYSFIFGGTHYINQNTKLIRKQLLNTDDKLIPDTPISKDYFPDYFLGGNIIYYPKELRSVLMVFDLETNVDKHRFGVILPGPDNFGFKVYSNWEKKLKRQEKFHFKAYSFPRKLDLTIYKDSIEFLRVWEHYNGYYR